MRTELAWVEGMVLKPRRSVSAEQLRNAQTAEEIAILMGDFNLAMVFRRRARDQETNHGGR